MRGPHFFVKMGPGRCFTLFLRVHATKRGDRASPAFFQKKKAMLRVADRDAKWAKWRAMASGVLDKSKLGRVLTARNVGAAGALVAAVGAGVLGSRYLAESQKKEDALRLDLDTRLNELRSMLEKTLQAQQTGLGKKVGVRQAALKKDALERRAIRAMAQETLDIKRTEAGISAQGGINEADRRKPSFIAAQQIVDAVWKLRPGLRVDAAPFNATAASRIPDSIAVTVNESPIGDPALGVSLGDTDRAVIEDSAASLLALVVALSEAHGQTLEATRLLVERQAQLEQGLTTLQEHHRAATDAATPQPQSRFSKLGSEAAARLRNVVGARQQRFGSAPLVLTLARALSAVRLPDRPEIARQMARVILATAALEAHREATESGRVADLYTTDRAD